MAIIYTTAISRDIINAYNAYIEFLIVKTDSDKDKIKSGVLYNNFCNACENENKSPRTILNKLRG